MSIFLSTITLIYCMLKSLAQDNPQQQSGLFAIHHVPQNQKCTSCSAQGYFSSEYISPILSNDLGTSQTQHTKPIDMD